MYSGFGGRRKGGGHHLFYRHIQFRKSGYPCRNLLRKRRYDSRGRSDQVFLNQHVVLAESLFFIRASELNAYCWVTIITDKVAKKIDNLQLKMIKAVSTKKVTNGLIKTVWKRQLCLIMQGCFWNVYLLATSIFEWLRLRAVLLLCRMKSKGILSSIIVKIVREIISFYCKRT